MFTLYLHQDLILCKNFCKRQISPYITSIWITEIIFDINWHNITEINWVKFSFCKTISLFYRIASSPGLPWLQNFSFGKKNSVWRWKKRLVWIQFHDCVFCKSWSYRHVQEGWFKLIMNSNNEHRNICKNDWKSLKKVRDSTKIKGLKVKQKKLKTEIELHQKGMVSV